MGLRDVVAEVERREKTLTLYNLSRDESLLDELRSYFRTHNVRITTERTPSGRPTDFAVLSVDDEFLGSIETGALRELIETVPPGPGGLGIDDSPYNEVLRDLKETTFTSYDSRQMLMATREIEDRAWRVGHGTLHAGFQRVSLMIQQGDVYRRLASTDLDVVMYSTRDGLPPDLGGATIVIEDSDELASFWFVVYDGGGVDDYKTALLAEMRAEDTFYGIWTYDPDVVDRICAYLETEYDPWSAGGRPSRHGL